MCDRAGGVSDPRAGDAAAPLEPESAGSAPAVPTAPSAAATAQAPTQEAPKARRSAAAAATGEALAGPARALRDRVLAGHPTPDDTEYLERVRYIVPRLDRGETQAAVAASLPWGATDYRVFNAFVRTAKFAWASAYVRTEATRLEAEERAAEDADLAATLREALAELTPATLSVLKEAMKRGDDGKFLNWGDAMWAAKEVMRLGKLDQLVKPPAPPPTDDVPPELDRRADEVFRELDADESDDRPSPAGDSAGGSTAGAA